MNAFLLIVFLSIILLLNTMVSTLSVCRDDDRVSLESLNFLKPPNFRES